MRKCIQCGIDKQEKSFRRKGKWLSKRCNSCYAGSKQSGQHLETLEQRLTRWMSVNPKTGCWEWLGAIVTGGYGGVGFQGRYYRAHRAAWLTWRGEIPKGLQVLHHCDNPKCINPEHLWLGTQQQNIDDCIAKGRFVANIAAWNARRGGKVPD